MRSYIVYFVFVLIAFFLWSLNKLRQDYISQIQIHTHLIHSANSSNFNSLEGETLTVRTKASGFFLMRMKVLDTKQATLDLNGLKGIDLTANNIQLPSLLLKDGLAALFDNGVSIIDIDPDTLHLTTTLQASKKIAILAQANLTFIKDVRQLKPIQFIPDSLVVFGDKELLAKINHIPVTIQHLLIANDIDAVATLPVIDNVNYNQKKVRYHIRVGRCTEKQFTIPIEIRNKPHNTALLLFPAVVQLTCLVPISVYENVTQNDFVLFIDYQDVANSSHRKIRVNIAQQSDNAINIKITPSFVEFLINKEKK